MPSYWLVSLPLLKGRRDTTWELLQEKTSFAGQLSSNAKLEVPELRIGTLDTLLQHSDDLAKISLAAEGLVGKLRRTLGDVAGAGAIPGLRVEALPVESYLTRFRWGLLAVLWLESVCVLSGRGVRAPVLSISARRAGAAKRGWLAAWCAGNGAVTSVTSLTHSSAGSGRQHQQHQQQVRPATLMPLAWLNPHGLTSGGMSPSSRCAAPSRRRWTRLPR
jgi:hypothetical protein